MADQLLTKIVLLKQKVDNAKKAPVLQRANAATAVIDEAIFIIEELATEHFNLKKLFSDLVDDVEGVKVNGK